MISTALNETKTVKIYTKYLKLMKILFVAKPTRTMFADSDPDHSRNTLSKFGVSSLKWAMAPKDFVVFDWDKRVNTSGPNTALEETIKKYPGNKTYAAAWSDSKVAMNNKRG